MVAHGRLPASGWLIPLLCLSAMDLQAAASDVEQGRAVYEQCCASCHGNTGKGDGPVAGALTPKPKALSDTASMSTKSDDQLLQVVKEGGVAVGLSPVMPPWGTSLTEDQMRNVIASIRSLAE